jgi:hypothetical protein
MDMLAETEPTEVPAPRDAPAATPTADLIRGALADARELVRIEVELAKGDLGAKLTDAKRAGILFALSAIGATVTTALLLVAVALATPVPWLTAAIMGSVLLVAAIVLAVLGARALPAKPLQPTRDRIDASIDTIKERLT